MRALAFLAAAGLAVLPAPALAATITIVNGDGPGEGFNDPTPVAPVGGNPGTTLGEQRLNAFQFAANIWGALLDSPVEIQIRAFFNPLTCTAASAVLGSAGALTVSSDFPGALLPGTWYSQALANRLSGSDTDPVTPDIQAQFNSNLNGNPACLGGTGWYLGFDDNKGTNIDLVTVLLHELAHGLGFQSFVNSATGALFLGLPDTYLVNLFDNTTGKTWAEMTDAERAASAINPRQVVWTGQNVTAAVPATLALGTPIMNIDAPASIAGERLVGGAAFGPPIGAPLSGEVALASDGVAAPNGGTPTDGCEPITSDVAGKIAILDRGLCGFTVKAANAQAAGAIAVVVADNVAGSPPAALGGADPAVTIPAVRVTLDTGNAIKAALPGVSLTIKLDLTRRAGADAEDHAMVNTPNPRVAGSSVSHWDTSTTPNLLMEPAINVDLGHDVDLTLPQMRDIGWLADKDLDSVLDDVDNCPTIANVGQEDGNEDGIGDACPIRPFVACVRPRGRGLLNFTAVFGVENAESVERSLAAAIPFNFVIPGINRGQPSTFAGGRTENAFEVPGSAIVIWALGEDIAFATPFSPRCR